MKKPVIFKVCALLVIVIMCFTSCIKTIGSGQEVENFGEYMISEYTYIETFDISKGTPAYDITYTIVDYTPTEEEINSLYEETRNFIFSDEIYYDEQERSRPGNYYFIYINIFFIVKNGEKEYLHKYALRADDDKLDTIIPDPDVFVLTSEKHKEISEETQPTIVAPFE